MISYKAVSEKKDILINAPTGTGKTLASLLAPIINFSEDVKSGSFTTIYISPLKSLIYDISRNLDEYLKAANLKISIETRTGDTSAYNKQKQLKKPPNFLITTPESFALMMSYDNSNVYFSNIKYIIIDELHSIIHTKRGDLLTLNLARLTSFAPEAIKIALSATIKNTTNTLNYFSNSKKRNASIQKSLKKYLLKF